MLKFNIYLELFCDHAQEVSLIKTNIKELYLITKHLVLEIKHVNYNGRLINHLMYTLILFFQ